MYPSIQPLRRRPDCDLYRHLVCQGAQTTAHLARQEGIGRLVVFRALKRLERHRLIASQGIWTERLGGKFYREMLWRAA